MEGMKPRRGETVAVKKKCIVPVGPHMSNPLMFKFPPELLVHKGNVCYLLYVAGGLLMTVTAGSRCVDVAVWTAQNPANLLRLSNALIRLVGLRKHNADSKAKGKLKRLFFTDSFNSLLGMTRTTLRGTHHFKVLGWFPERQTNLDSANNCVSARRYDVSEVATSIQNTWLENYVGMAIMFNLSATLVSDCNITPSPGRCRIYYILICGVSSRPVLTLRLGNNSTKLKTYNPPNQLQWLINFSSEAKARRDVIFLLLGGQTGHICCESFDTNDAMNEHHPTSLTLGLSALSVVVLLWMFLPHIAVFAVICLGWKVLKLIH